eukprot:757189-Hanusia_phi.AAC.3
MSSFLSGQDRQHLHPLVIPVAVIPASGAHVCLLRMASASKVLFSARCAVACDAGSAGRPASCS